MKKIILFIFLTCTISVNAQLLQVDSAFQSLDNGNTYKLLVVSFFYHNAADCKLAYGYSKQFDDAGQELKNLQYDTLTYYDNGTTKTHTTLLWDNGLSRYSLSHRESYTYFQSTSKEASILQQIWKNNEWLNTSLQTNVYDADGYLLSTLNEDWDTLKKEWLKSAETTYYNNFSGIPDSALSQYFENGTVISRNRILYTYYPSSLLPQEKITQIYDSEQWQNYQRETYTYTEIGQKYRVNAYDFTDQGWEFSLQQTIYYNPDGTTAKFTIRSKPFPIIGAILQKTTFNYTPCVNLPGNELRLCTPLGSTVINAGVMGNGYRWQVNTGNGFVDISDNGNYAGTTTASLNLSDIPSSWYGYQFRCIADNQNSSIFTIKFVNKWTGANSNVWNNAANWSCGTLPDANTDIIIDSGTVILDTDANVRSLIMMPGVSFTANTGVKLTITH